MHAQFRVRGNRVVGVRLSSRRTAAAKALAALVVVLVVVALTPAVLWAWRHNPLPTHLEPVRWGQLALRGYIHPDLVPNLLAVAAWLVWAQIVLALGRETAARIRRGAAASRSAFVLPPLQRLACYVVAAISLATTIAASQPEVTPPLVSLAQTAPATAPTNLTTGLTTNLTAPHQTPPPAMKPDLARNDTHGSRIVPTARVHTVQPDDRLWDIAETYYPDARPTGIRRIVRAIFTKNKGVSDGRGHRLHDPDLINPGMRLRLPTITTGHPHTSPQHPSPPAVSSRPQSNPPAPPSTAPEASPRTSPLTSPHDPTTPTPVQSPSPSPSSSGHVPRALVPETLPDTPTVPASLPVWVGSASLLATGFAGLWTYRRSRRDGKVKPSQAVPPPDPTLIPLHTAVRLAANPDGPARLDAALRSLAVLHAAQQTKGS